MSELPKSVREQLARAQVPANSHPDADLLTAYGENSLGATERQRVSEHVAACAECREVLFLAQPELEQAQVVAKPAPLRRFGWMAWASVAAVIVVVGSAVVIQQERVKNIEQPITVGSDTKPEPIQQDKSATVQAPKAPVRTREQDTIAKSAKPALIMAPVPGIAAPTTRETAGIDQKQKDDLLKSGVAANERGQQNAQGVNAGNQIPSGPGNTANANVTNVYTAQNTAPAAAPMQKARKTEAARDALVPSTAFGYSLDAGARRELGRAHWRISKTGGIERSYLDDEWKPVLAGAGVRFRVVSVVRNVVWAGGNHGALYVSRDGGTNWAPVTIDSTADVVSIQFGDEVNGKIQTSDGETWKTTDGGNSWSPQ
jgi:hypothetical protein